MLFAPQLPMALFATMSLAVYPRADDAEYMPTRRDDRREARSSGHDDREFDPQYSRFFEEQPEEREGDDDFNDTQAKYADVSAPRGAAAARRPRNQVSLQRDVRRRGQADPEGNVETEEKEGEEAAATIELHGDCTANAKGCLAGTTCVEVDVSKREEKVVEPAAESGTETAKEDAGTETDKETNEVAEEEDAQKRRGAHKKFLQLQKGTRSMKKKLGEIIIKMVCLKDDDQVCTDWKECGGGKCAVPNAPETAEPAATEATKKKAHTHGTAPEVEEDEDAGGDNEGAERKLLQLQADKVCSDALRTSSMVAVILTAILFF